MIEPVEVSRSSVYQETPILLLFYAVYVLGGLAFRIDTSTAHDAPELLVVIGIGWSDMPSRNDIFLCHK